MYAVFTVSPGPWSLPVMTFGLCDAPDTFEKQMKTVLKVLPREISLVYFDEIKGLFGLRFMSCPRLSRTLEARVRDPDGREQLIKRCLNRPYLFLWRASWIFYKGTTAVLIGENKFNGWHRENTVRVVELAVFAGSHFRRFTRTPALIGDRKTQWVGVGER